MTKNNVQLSAPLKKMQRMVEQKVFDSPQLEMKVLEELGVFALRGVLSNSLIAHFRETYYKDIETGHLEKTDYHLTEVKVAQNHKFYQLFDDKAFVGICRNFFNGNVGVDFVRVVKKDKVNSSEVFPHQDTGYQIGSYDRYSLFIPLTECKPENGSLTLYPGTKNFGYLGDVGEIDVSILPKGYPKIKSHVLPGDILIMHSATWHESPENVLLTDRVYLEIHIQDVNELTTQHVVCGSRTSEWSLRSTKNDIYDTDPLFLDSRKQRVKTLSAKVLQLERDQ